MRKPLVGLAVIAAVATPLAFASSANAVVPALHHRLHRGDHRQNARRRRHLADDRPLRRGDHRRATDSALRISNAVTSGSFGDQLFSPTLAVPATETGPARHVHRVLRARAGRASAGPAGDGQPRQRPGRPGRLPRDRAHQRRHRTWSARGRSSTRRAALDWAVTNGGHRARPEQAAHRDAQARQEAEHEEVDQQRRLLGPGRRQAGQEHHVRGLLRGNRRGQLPDRHADVPPQRAPRSRRLLGEGLLIDDVTIATS